MTAALLNIAALSRRTGVAPDTLRKWEQRYGVLQPTRTAGGQRRYSEADVQRVEWLRDRIAEGWRVGEAARVLDETRSSALDDPGDLRSAMIEAIKDSAPVELSALLHQAFAVLPLEQALTDVVTPVLRWTGDAWHRGELTVAQEHAVTAKVRAHLDSLIAGGQGGVRGVVALACAPGERHELGLLMLGVMLRADGWRVEFLGPDTPVETATAYAERIGAAILCFSTTMDDSLESLRSSLASIDRPDGVVLAIGGEAATAALARDLGMTYVNGRLSGSVARLRKLGAR